MEQHRRMSRFAVYIDVNDWWVGVYRGPLAYYVCPLPCVVFRVRRRLPVSRSYGQ